MANRARRLLLKPSVLESVLAERALLERHNTSMTHLFSKTAAQTFLSNAWSARTRSTQTLTGATKNPSQHLHKEEKMIRGKYADRLDTQTFFYVAQFRCSMLITVDCKYGKSEAAM